MAHDPPSTTDLDRYHETLEREGDPLVAWEAAWGEEVPAAPEPEASYARLLEAGIAPDRAWERAYGEVEPVEVALLDDLGEPIAVDLAELHELPTTGRDLWGDTTVLVTECVLGLAMDLVRTMARSCGNPNLDVRVLVLSSSAGLTAAARWVAISPLPIHALVDTEGPGDSMEITGSHNAWTSDDLKYVEGGSAFFFPTGLTWQRWREWTGVEVGAASDEFELFFRTPGLVLASKTLGEDGATFAAALMAAYGDARWFDFLPDEKYRFRESMNQFWMRREPRAWLAAVIHRGTAYIRLQGETNHATAPDWYHGRNAVQNLHAAFLAGVDGMVFYCGEEWRARVEDDHRDGVVLRGPNGMVSDLNPDLWETAVRPWPTWCQDSGASFLVSYAWQAQVDVLRWAFQTEFPSPPSLSPEPLG